MVSRYVLYTLVAFMMAVMGLATPSSSHDTAAGDPEARKTGQQTGTAVHRVEAAPRNEILCPEKC
jgi:hypothetical protein